MENNKRPKRRIKIGYILALIIIIAFGAVVLKLVLPSSGTSKYGDRLEGIENYKFSKKAQKKVIDLIKGKEQVSSCKIEVHGKRIDVIFNVKKDVSKDDAKNIANESLGAFTEKVKGYYDIQYMISKKKEEGIKVTVEEGKEETKYEFPIMGYSNKKNSGIVWTNN